MKARAVLVLLFLMAALLPDIDCGAVVVTEAKRFSPQLLKGGQRLPSTFVPNDKPMSPPHVQVPNSVPTQPPPLSTPAPPSKQRSDTKSTKKSDKKGKRSSVGPIPQDLTPPPTPEVTIEPPLVDFHSRSLCWPVVETVEIVNTSEDEELLLYAVSTDSVQFHPSFFTKSIPSGENATVSVVYLPRSLEAIDDTILIQTSFGSFLYGVQGSGVPNPYGLKPLLGLRVLVGKPYKPCIEVYNPFNNAVQVTEVFSSGGFLQLNLPEGTQSTPTANSLWEIAPHDKKSIINLTFMSQAAGQYQGFVSVKIAGENMIVPVEVLVVKDGLHSNPEMIDFGTVVCSGENASEDPYFSETTMQILNGDSESIRLNQIAPAYTHPSTIMNVNAIKNVIPAKLESTVARISFSAKQEGVFSGKFAVQTNSSNPLFSQFEIPYKARAFCGSLSYLQQNAEFPVLSGGGKFRIVERILSLTNRFSIPIIVYGGTIADPHYRIVDGSTTFPITIAPGSAWAGFVIHFLPTQNDMMYSVDLEISTNITRIRIPLHCYHGGLAYSVLSADTLELGGSNDSQIDFGFLGINQLRTRQFMITNSNPITVPIHSIKSPIPEMTIKLDSVWNNQVSASQRSQKKILASTDDNSLLTLEPNHSALFTVELSSSREEQKNVSISLLGGEKTLDIPVSYRIVSGTLSLVGEEAIVFQEPSFPGKTLTHPIIVRSTYSREIEITSLSSSDPRTAPIITTTNVLPNEAVEIGHIVFDPAKGYYEKLYMQEIDSFKEELSKPGQALQKVDLQAFKTREMLWEKLYSEGHTSIVASLSIRTDMGSNHQVPVRATLIKPSILPFHSLEFEPTQIGSASVQPITVFNPSSHVIYVEILPLSSDASFQLSSSQLERLEPLEQREIGSVSFLPDKVDSFASTIYIKNNLTILDALPLVGQGAISRLVILRENGEEDQQNSFSFELKATGAMMDCNSVGEPQTVSRHFQAVNLGTLPVHVQTMLIDNSPCQGHGFHVHDCDCDSGSPMFTLKPGQKRNVTITFTPDFSSPTSVIQQVLHIHSSQKEPLSFPMVAVLPYHCSSETADKSQTPFETNLQAILILLILFIVLAVGSLALLECRWNSEKYLLKPIAVLSQDDFTHFGFNGDSVESVGLEPKSVDLSILEKVGVTPHETKPAITSSTRSTEPLARQKEVIPQARTPPSRTPPRLLTPPPSSDDEALSRTPRLESYSEPPSGESVKSKEVVSSLSNSSKNSSDSITKDDRVPLSSSGEGKEQKPTKQRPKKKRDQESKKKANQKSSDESSPALVEDQRQKKEKPVPLESLNTTRAPEAKKVAPPTPLPSSPLPTPALLPSHPVSPSSMKRKKPTPVPAVAERMVIPPLKSKVQEPAAVVRPPAPVVVEKKVVTKRDQLKDNSSTTKFKFVEKPKPAAPVESQPKVAVAPPSVAKDQLRLGSKAIVKVPSSGIGGMDTAGDTRCEPRRSPPIGVIGSGKGRDQAATEVGIWNRLPQPALSLDTTRILSSGQPISFPQIAPMSLFSAPGFFGAPFSSESRPAPQPSYTISSSYNLFEPRPRPKPE